MNDSSVAHPTDEQLKLYGQRALSVDDLLSIDEHLGLCADCRMRYDRIDTNGRELEPHVDRLLSEILISEHLTYEMRSGYVNRTLGKAESDEVKAHLKSCVDCRDDVESLQAFHDRLRAETATEQPVPWWRRLPALRRVAPAFGLTAAAFLIGLLLPRPPGKQEAIKPLQGQSPQVAQASHEAETLKAQVIRTQQQVDTLTRALAAQKATVGVDVERLRQQLAGSREQLAQQQRRYRALQDRPLVALLTDTDASAPVRYTGIPTASQKRNADPNVEDILFAAPVAPLQQESRPWLSWKDVDPKIEYSIAVLNRRTRQIQVLPVKKNARPTPGDVIHWRFPVALRSGPTYDLWIQGKQAGSDKQWRSDAVPFKVMSADEAQRARANSLGYIKVAGELVREGRREAAKELLQSIQQGDPVYSIAQQRLQELKDRETKE